MQTPHYFMRRSVGSVKQGMAQAEAGTLRGEPERRAALNWFLDAGGGPRLAGGQG